MKPSEGDIYYDKTFNSEIEVLEIEGNSVLLKDSIVGDGDYRDYRLTDLEHNISVGRFEKVGEEDESSFEVEVEEKNEGVFSY